MTTIVPIDRCPRCRGSMLPEGPGMTCLSCGHTWEPRPTKPLSIPSTKGYRQRAPKMPRAS